MKRLLSVLILAMGVAGAAQSQDYSFTGTFSDDDDVQYFVFATDGVSLIELITYGYAGGTMADGTDVDAGGFDPILTLFDSLGVQVGFNDDGGSSNVNADPVTGDYYDTYFSAVLAAGTYTVAISQYNNFSLGDLGDGFQYDYGDPTFTSVYGCSNGVFCDVNTDNRTGEWAFDVLGAQRADVVPGIPEPATWLMMILGFGIVASATRRRRIAELNA